MLKKVGRVTGTITSAAGKLKQRVDEAPSVTAWCSWCGVHGLHNRVKERIVGRSDYVCTSCEGPTVKCRYCDNMARGAGAFNGDGDEVQRGVSGDEPHKSKVATYLKARWTNELCSEHDGTIPDFSKAHMKIADFSEFADLMKPRQKNYYGMARNTAVAAGEAFAITLGGGALAIAAAAGAGLGGKTGFGIANAYLKDIPDYHFAKVQAGDPDSSHSVVVVNGLLSELDSDRINQDDWSTHTSDWVSGLRGVHDSDTIWHLNWEAKNLAKLGSWAGMATGSRIMSMGSGPAGLLITASTNPWHAAMVNAEKTGVLLAEAISRVEGQTFTLMGHSLGARVILFALMNLATRSEKRIKDAVLMGGAVGRSHTKSWSTAASALTGTLFNCHSANDDILRRLYRMANIGLSQPAGLAPAAPSACNVDCSDLISGHTAWKVNLPQVMERISALGQ